MWMPNFIVLLPRGRVTRSELLLGAAAAEAAALAREAGLGARRARAGREGGHHRQDLQRPLPALVREERLGGEPGQLAPVGAAQGPLDGQRRQDEQRARRRE